MEEKEIIAENPVTIAGVTIIPIVRVLFHRWHGSRGASSWGIKEPVSIVVVSTSVRKAFRITGDEIPLDELIQEVPGINEILKNI